SREVYHFVFERGIHILELIVMSLFYLLFLILGSRKLGHRLRRAFPGPRGEDILTIGGQMRAGIDRFIKGKTLVRRGVGATSALLMSLFGLDHWLLWGFLFFALNYITYIGSMVALVPPIIMAFLDLDTVLAALVLTVLLTVNRFIWIDYVEIR